MRRYMKQLELEKKQMKADIKSGTLSPQQGASHYFAVLLTSNLWCPTSRAACASVVSVPVFFAVL